MRANSLSDEVENVNNIEGIPAVVNDDSLSSNVELFSATTTSSTIINYNGTMPGSVRTVTVGSNWVLLFNNSSTSTTWSVIVTKPNGNIDEFGVGYSAVTRSGSQAGQITISVAGSGGNLYGFVIVSSD
ncbi:MAG: hypothetical protein LBD11_08160 [Candidatus Peribacteria bacterium]|nr:hypothetical protein [Candidatus Peribacteria bacterium]